jgi:pSer/pThr/pTyr-binding forkhead associated (FHA) protein
MSSSPEDLAVPTSLPEIHSGPRVQLRNPGAPDSAPCETTRLVTLIGSRRDCDLPLNDPEVSKIHCAIVHTGRGLLVCDLCSRTGTFVNGQPIRVVPLVAGDTLRVGPVEIALEFLTPTMPNPAEPAGPPAPVELRLGEQCFNLAETAVIIGRRHTCGLVLDTPDVSLAHALVFAHQDQPVVFDLGSRSGTLLNARRIRLAPLQHGDRVGIGGETLIAQVPGNRSPNAAVLLPMITVDDDAPKSPASARTFKRRAARQGQEWLCAMRSDESAGRRQLEQRALDLDRRAAELDTLAALVALEREHLDHLKAELARREDQVAQTEKEARERLALAVAHEQAVTAAWEELDRWHSSRADTVRPHGRTGKKAATRAGRSPHEPARADVPPAFAPPAVVYPANGANAGNV